MTVSSILRVALPAALLLAITGCAPITQRSGFQPVDDRPQDIRAGTDTRSTVLSRLGSPSTTSAFPPVTWYYISQVTERTAFQRPRVVERTVTTIAFNAQDQVSEIHTYGIEAGRIIDFSTRETPTRGRELTILEQLLGNVGRVNNLPNDESQTAEGRRRRDTGR